MQHTVAVQRALETTATPPFLGDALFEKMLASRSGFVFTAHEYDEIFQLVKHPDGKIHLAVPELLDWLARLDPAADQGDPAYPFTLVAGQRRMHNANQIFRTPAWRKSDPDGALRIHPDDIAALGTTDGVGWRCRPGPGASCAGSRRPVHAARPRRASARLRSILSRRKGARIVDGPRLNLITAHDDCDPIAATPYHKNVAVHLEPVAGVEAEAAAAASRACARSRRHVRRGMSEQRARRQERPDDDRMPRK
jgi:hypothetical protein